MAQLCLVVLVWMVGWVAGMTTMPCCEKKMVGGESYTLVKEGDTTSFNCVSNCVYQKDGEPGGQLFCFAAGEQEAMCEDPGKKEGETCGSYYCPSPPCSAGECEPGLTCVYDEMIADAPGRCKRIGVPCDDSECRSRFPEGGHCSFNPVSPFCNPRTPKCLSPIGRSCSCCRNCHDQGCSSLGRGWSCVNETTAQASTKPCVRGGDGKSLCWSSPQGGTQCFCCPPDDPQECKDTGCKAEGGQCMQVRSEESDCRKVSEVRRLCSQTSPDVPCSCCLESVKPCNQTSYCSKRGAGYSCIPRKEALNWPLPCKHSCTPLGNKIHCMCCPPKPIEVECVDTGCSKQPGFECKNESVASKWPKQCRKSPQLCSNTIERYELNVTADNAFELYGDGVHIGGGSDWQEIFTFHTSASKVLAIVAKDWHYYEGIVLSSSNGLVATDKSWKCIDSDLVTSGDWAVPDYNDLSWPDAVSYGYCGVAPWGQTPGPGISSAAHWIWAPNKPNKVYCRKKLEIPPCFCCPPIDPINSCRDTGGCDGAFGPKALGQCVDITNPDLQSLNKTYDLLAKPTPDFASVNLCTNTVDESCCRCFKKKSCIDDGCEKEFDGNGICVDVERDDLSNIDLSVEKKLGLCKHTFHKDCCFCYKKFSKPDCKHKTCYSQGLEGECVGPKGSPPPDYINTHKKCSGNDCTCWVPDTCTSDPVCADLLHGQCVPDKPGITIPDHSPSKYKCRGSLSNCTCWTPSCQHRDCTGRGGECLLPWEQVPPGYGPSGLTCNEELDCKCYIKQCRNTECAEKDGICLLPTDPVPVGYQSEGWFCDQNLKCECYTKSKCENEECKEKDGICLLPTDPVPEGYKSDGVLMCNEELACKCYIKQCKNTECAEKDGICLLPTDPVPEGYKSDGWFCDQDLNCQCYTKPKLIEN